MWCRVLANEGGNKVTFIGMSCQSKNVVCAKNMHIFIKYGIENNEGICSCISLQNAYRRVYPKQVRKRSKLKTSATNKNFVPKSFRWNLLKYYWQTYCRTITPASSQSVAPKVNLSRDCFVKHTFSLCDLHKQGFH